MPNYVDLLKNLDKPLVEESPEQIKQRLIDKVNKHNSNWIYFDWQPYLYLLYFK